MSLISRMLSGFFVVSALLLTLASLSAEWVFEACTVTDSTGRRISLLDAHRQGEQLTRELQATLERTNTKEKIADMVIGDEMSLIEAAAWFRSLHDKRTSWDYLLRPGSGQNEGEGWCRIAIDYVDNKVRFEQSPSRADALRQRLEAELKEHLDCHGGVELPD